MDNFIKTVNFTEITATIIHDNYQPQNVAVMFPRKLNKKQALARMRDIYHGKLLADTVKLAYSKHNYQISYIDFINAAKLLE